MKKIYCLIIIALFHISVNSQWVIVNTNINHNINKAAFHNIFTGFVAAFMASDSSGYLLKTADGGLTWSNTVTQPGPMHNVYILNENEVFAVGKSNVWVSSNNGNTWLQRYFENYELFDIRFQNALSAYVCGYHSPDSRACLVRSSDRGITWNFVFALEDSYKLFCIRFPSPIVGYTCGEHGKLRKVVEGVTSWTVISTGTIEDLNSLYFFNTETGYAAGNNSTLLKTTNGGYPWFPLNTGFSNIHFKSIQFYDDNTGYIIGSNGFVARSTNGGNTWSQQSSQTSQSLNGINILNKDTILAAGNSGILLRTFNGGNPIGINIISANIPSGYKIYQNFPNPFNPATQINFDIPNVSFVKLIIYDQLGKVIEQLVNEELVPGSYKYNWNASSFPSGIYYSKLQAGDYFETKKMVLIK